MILIIKAEIGICYIKNCIILNRQNICNGFQIRDSEYVISTITYFKKNNVCNI